MTDSRGARSPMPPFPISINIEENLANIVLQDPTQLLMPGGSHLIYLVLCPVGFTDMEQSKVIYLRMFFIMALFKPEAVTLRSGEKSLFFICKKTFTVNCLQSVRVTLRRSLVSC